MFAAVGDGRGGNGQDAAAHSVRGAGCCGHFLRVGCRRFGCQCLQGRSARCVAHCSVLRTRTRTRPTAHTHNPCPCAHSTLFPLRLDVCCSWRKRVTIEGVDFILDLRDIPSGDSATSSFIDLVRPCCVRCVCVCVCVCVSAWVRDDQYSQYALCSKRSSELCRGKKDSAFAYHRPHRSAWWCA